jgi:hypothetical protein
VAGGCSSQAQQVLAAGIESDAHVAFAAALVGAVELFERHGQGAQVGQEPAQRLWAGDGHAWAKRAIEIEVHGLYGASAGRDEADEDVACLHMAHTCLRILRAAVIAARAPADVAEARGRGDRAAGQAIEHRNHARLWLSASVASHARKIALRGQVKNERKL